MAQPRKVLSSETRKALDRLSQDNRLAFRFAYDLAAVESLLGRVDPRNAPGADREIAAAAQPSIRFQPAKIRNQDLSFLQRVFGVASKVRDDRSQHYQGAIGDFDVLNKNPEFALLFISHFDGRLREKALRSLDRALPSAFHVALLEWRLNDWVQQVREVAKSTTARCYAKTNAHHLVDAMIALLPRRVHWRR